MSRGEESGIRRRWGVTLHDAAVGTRSLTRLGRDRGCWFVARCVKHATALHAAIMAGIDHRVRTRTGHDGPGRGWNGEDTAISGSGWAARRIVRRGHAGDHDEHWHDRTCRESPLQADDGPDHEPRSPRGSRTPDSKIRRQYCQRKNQPKSSTGHTAKRLPAKFLRIANNSPNYFAAPSFQIPLSMSEA